mmetsp:Transcript_20027/g.52074  ORF Transcript_20027/g.52074 Transcript_20027/m.52074 type:complete len:217 (+) Transcript_20027:276-926(+)
MSLSFFRFTMMAFAFRVWTVRSLLSIISCMRRSPSWIFLRVSSRRYSAMRLIRSTFSSFIWSRNLCFSWATTLEPDLAARTLCTFSSSNSNLASRSSFLSSSCRLVAFKIMASLCSCKVFWWTFNNRSRSISSNCSCLKASWCAFFCQKCSLRFSSIFTAWAMFRWMRASIWARRSCLRCRSSSCFFSTRARRSCSASSISFILRLMAFCCSCIIL